ncbi:unnamed protein product, partial [Rotaria magnacalcarata]
RITLYFGYRLVVAVFCGGSHSLNCSNWCGLYIDGRV